MRGERERERDRENPSPFGAEQGRLAQGWIS